MTYFLYIRASRRSGGKRHWFKDTGLTLSDSVLAAGAFNEREAAAIARCIPLANVYRVPCDSTIHLTEAMRRTLKIA